MRIGQEQRRIRSTKAGRLTPATPFRWRRRSTARRPLNEGREINPGDTWARPPSPSGTGALNEGREINPGDTDGGAKVADSEAVAQRRPGD